MRNEMLYGIIGFIVGVIITVLLTSNAVNTNQTNMMRMMGIRQNISSENSQIIDQHFIEQMIPHHEDAITMAKLAQTRAKTPEVQQLAKNIIDSQGREITQMKQWYKEWFGRELPTGTEVMQHHGMGSNAGMHMGMMGDETDVRRLEDAENFDRAFVEQMIPHHQMAVMMASMLKNGTTRPEMKQLADDIITAQTSEIDQMRAWLNRWSK